MKRTLKGRILVRSGVRIGVIGVGYVGLPIALKLNDEGFSVTGIDVSSDVVKKLRSGRSTVEGIADAWLKKALANGFKLEIVNKERPEETHRNLLRKLVGIDIFLICVPTPLDQFREWEPDTSYIERAYALIERICSVEKELRKLPTERLIVLESTTYPGTTRKVFSPLFTRFKSSKQKWYLAYSPERMNPGPNAYDDSASNGPSPGHAQAVIPGAFQTTRIVGGIDRASREITKTFYETVFREVRAVSNIETAEMIKLVENTFRFTSIGFANELCTLAKTLGLNVWEIIDAARGKGFGFELCFPGLIGGHCLPIDPHYLSWATRNKRVAFSFVDVAEGEHQNMRREAFDLIQRLLNQRNKGIAGASILFLGVSYKKNVGDIRESGAIKLMGKLFAAGARVSFWDPIRAKHPAKPRIRLTFTIDEAKSLPNNIRARLKTDHTKNKYYVEPKELKGEWKEVDRKIQTSKLSCIVLATDHDDFRRAYADLILRKDIPIADLCNAIGWWLKDFRTSPADLTQIKQKIKERTNYMLLGLH